MLKIHKCEKCLQALTEGLRCSSYGWNVRHDIFFLRESHPSHRNLDRSARLKVQTAVTIKVEVFWVVTLCGAAFRRTMLHPLSGCSQVKWRWRQQCPPKCSYPTATTWRPNPQDSHMKVSYNCSVDSGCGSSTPSLEFAYVNSFWKSGPWNVWCCWCTRRPLLPLGSALGPHRAVCPNRNKRTCPPVANSLPFWWSIKRTRQASAREPISDQSCIIK